MSNFLIAVFLMLFALLGLAVVLVPCFEWILDHIDIPRISAKANDVICNIIVWVVVVPVLVVMSLCYRTEETEPIEADFDL